MARLTWTPQALDDIEAICEFIAKDAPRYAQLFATQVFGSALLDPSYLTGEL
jgi:plasmid stabilization system protein ParE